ADRAGRRLHGGSEDDPVGAEDLRVRGRSRGATSGSARRRQLRRRLRGVGRRRSRTPRPYLRLTWWAVRQPLHEVDGATADFVMAVDAVVRRPSPRTRTGAEPWRRTR